MAPDKAFHFSARALDAQTVEARFTIADGYYLYRDKIHFALDPASGALVTPTLPAGKIKQDEFFGRVETYRGSMTVNLAVKNFTPGKPLDDPRRIPRLRRHRHLLSADDPDGDRCAAGGKRRPWCRCRGAQKDLVQLSQ